MSTVIGRTLVSDSYGETLPYIPDRPEPARVKARRLNRAEVQKKMRWTDEGFDVAQRHRFPNAIKRVKANQAYGWELVWAEDQLDVWADNLRADIAAMKL